MLTLRCTWRNGVASEISEGNAPETKGAFISGASHDNGKSKRPNEIINFGFVKWFVFQT
jgi:hypothetical protein